MRRSYPSDNEWGAGYDGAHDDYDPRSTAPRSPAGRYDDGYGGGRYDDGPGGPRAAAGRASAGRVAAGDLAADGPPVGPGAVPPPGGGSVVRSQNVKKWKRRRRILALVCVILMMLGFVVVGGTYYFLSVPTPNELTLPQSSTVYYADGKTEMAKLSEENRTLVDINQIPKDVQNAVVAAEDGTFWTNKGIDIRGVFRAGWNNLTGGRTQGASTITQQYAGLAMNLRQDVSYTRKTKEAAMALKLDSEYSKEKILEMYLNTVYFGRGAHGIEAAAQTYFKKSVKDLDFSQGAALASVIKDPSGFDPDENPEEGKGRWSYVLDRMAQEKFVDQARIDKAKAAGYPKHEPNPKQAKQWWNSPEGIIVRQVQQELAAKGIKNIDTGGYKIFTTIDPVMQNAALTAAKRDVDPNGKIWKGQPGNLAASLVAVEPRTGKIKAYYGGDKIGWDRAGQYSSEGKTVGGGQPMGSSFKIYTLAAALADKDKSISIKSKWNGLSPQKFKTRDAPVSNASNDKSCGAQCPLYMATVKSLNTPFYAVTEHIGADKVVDMAHKAGIKSIWDNNGTRHDLDKVAAKDIAPSKISYEVGFGQFAVTLRDHATGFATFAADGLAVESHFVEKVVQRTPEGADKQVYAAKPKQEQAFSKEIAGDLHWALQKVFPDSDKNHLASGRPTAAKTGTWEFNDGKKASRDENAHATVGGYTPQLAAAVWMGDLTGKNPIKDKSGKAMYGSMVPGDIWKSFMDKAHAGKEEKKFTEPSFVGDEHLGNAPSPSPSPKPVQPTAEPTRPTPGPDPTKPPSTPPVEPTPPHVPIPTPSRSRGPGNG